MGAHRFLRTENEKDYFLFCCNCGGEGELGIAVEDGMQPFECPEGCGTLYVRWTPQGEQPRLRAVVEPVWLDDTGVHPDPPF